MAAVVHYLLAARLAGVGDLSGRLALLAAIPFGWNRLSGAFGFLAALITLPARLLRAI